MTVAAPKTLLARGVGLCCLALALGTWAAGPERVASYDRDLWPESIDSPERFDRASRQEILAFTRVLQRTPLDDADALIRFTGVKAPNQASVKLWLEQSRQRLLANYRAAGGSADSWTALLEDAQAPVADARWQAAAEGFHATYLYEQVRLAALFPAITSEIARLDESELTGDELPDRHFALSFDDGPSANQETEQLRQWLQGEGISAFFFVLGENLERRLKTKPAQSLNALYAGQCLASHGYRHVSHQKLGAWQDSLERTRQLIDSVQPAGPATSLWFRPPYGQRNAELVAYLKAQDGRVVLWSIDSQDWNARLKPDAMQDRLITLMLLWRKGMLLFHDIHPKARQVLPELQRFVRAGGLTLERCQALVEPTSPR
ncbi:MAG: polysaccharide deacetylase family protein [Aquipseudomonas alcaligenes]|uniref:Polysaccharide deacetylase family protein n=1 Tax=Aquipseudomonas alcaligenes TaxID=43263 RepID=A0A5C7WFV0_AQUAC|nr:MAG: polysaccharide deacetylase family protein [Pseudomonas alcaligenes]